MSLWRRKLLALLHDAPHMPVGIRPHQELRERFLQRLGLSGQAAQDFPAAIDWTAAAADRLIFPSPARSGLRVDWGESWLEFRHPLGGGVLHADAFPPTSAQMVSGLEATLEATGEIGESDWHRRYLAIWRLWPEMLARTRNGHFAYLVADTRIPDHTLWHHNALASALTSCGGRPAFLLFQIGPVQEFIAQSRKTLDLWSGSYLLSYLVAQAMLAIADGESEAGDGGVQGVGPDAVVFPQLRGMPLADLHWCEGGCFDLDHELRASHSNERLSPNLPNRFLALVPAERAGELAALAERRVVQTWRNIASAVRTHVAARIPQGAAGWDTHWSDQIDRFPVIDWIVHEWSDTKAATERARRGIPPLHGGWEEHPLRHARHWAEECIPLGHREAFGPDGNAGFAWALHFEAAEWKLAARKSARGFPPWRAPGQPPPDGIPKDHLDGRNEVLGGRDHEQFWSALRQAFPGQFRGSQLYGAISVIKRLWPEAYLREVLGWKTWRPDFESVPEIARIDRDLDGEGEEAEVYYAILAMDGDDMGRWVGGTNAAPLVGSLAAEAGDYFRAHWHPPTPSGPQAGEVKRPLSPGYHAALSEALANFSLYVAGPVVREFGGQLIYAGGDDVLAMLPGTAGLDCAQALQLAFAGLHPDDPDAHASPRVKEVLEKLFHYPSEWQTHPRGFLKLNSTSGQAVGRGGHLKPNWPLLVMGPRASVSTGIAVGHVRSPMQDTIQAAREAEKASKATVGKGAVTIRVLKRSGEGVGFTARWRDGVIGIWAELEAEIHDLSNRFAHRYASLVKPLVIVGGGAEGARYAETWQDGLAEAVEAELRYVLRQQGDLDPPRARETAARWSWLLTRALSPRDFLHFWMTWAFLHRPSPTEAPARP